MAHFLAPHQAFRITFCTPLRHTTAHFSAQQGAGRWTMESMVWGDVEHPTVKPGYCATDNPHDYFLPSTTDSPRDFRVTLLGGVPNPRAVHSSKAVGEPPFFLSSSVFFALKDAVRAARIQTLGYVAFVGFGAMVLQRPLQTKSHPTQVHTYNLLTHRHYRVNAGQSEVQSTSDLMLR